MAQIDKDELKSQLTTEDIDKIILSLNGEVLEPDRKGNLIYSTCTCHGGDSPKLSYRPSIQSFFCFTRCGKIGDIFELVIKSKEAQGYQYTFPEAVRYVSQVTNKSPQSSITKGQRSNITGDMDWLNKFKPKKKMESQLPVFDECVLDVFMPYPHEAWLDEITYETQMKYEIKYLFRDNAIIIPHRDKDGNLIGIRQRNLNEEDVQSGRKYIPSVINGQMYNFPTMFNLYGFYQNKGNIKKYGKCMIVEGEKSVLRLDDFYKNSNFSVAVSGSALSSYQRDLILQTGVSEVFIAFDKFRAQKEVESDEKYAKFTLEYHQKLIRIAQMFTPFVQTYIIYDMEDKIGYKDSPVDADQEAFEYLMRNKIEINTKDEMLEV